MREIPLDHCLCTACGWMGHEDERIADHARTLAEGWDNDRHIFCPNCDASPVSMAFPEDDIDPSDFEI